VPADRPWLEEVHVRTTRAVVVLAGCLLTAGLCLFVLQALHPHRVTGVAFPAIDAGAVLRHTKVLASDAFEGRAPGTRGEERTVAYLADEFRRMGATPAGPGGSYFQAVPLVGCTPEPGASLVFRKGADSLSLAFRDDAVVWTKRMVETASLDQSDLVFVGYGVQAPEFGWDDYRGLDLHGKTMVVLIGDPPVADPAHPGSLDPTMFGGAAMTYYGRWTYKLEMAAKMGAAGALIVHETGPAGYAFSVVQVKTGEQFDIARPDRNMSRAAVEGWITLEKARALFAMAGRDFEAEKARAAVRGFEPVPLGVKASITLRNRLRTITSHNVVAKIEGRDPVLKREYVLYTAHWDHFGIGAPVNGDPVYHGAVDNAVAVSGLLEIARAFARMPVPPRRTVVFLSVTAEEQLLLGSEYYAANPLYPLDRTAAVINLEMLNVHGRTRDLTVVGLGQSDLDDLARAIAGEQGRWLEPDPEPERGMYYRSDHFSFVRRGVPAFEPDHGDDYIGKPAGYGRQVRSDFFANLYHKPTDTVKADWDLRGGVEDLQFFWMMGYRVAESNARPQWKPGAEFHR
jgi:Zn-dependent M28 family amino/carboxypeptidase